MRALEKDFLREVQHSKSRFLSIFILAALAVAFLSGLRATAPDMKQTIDSYMDEAHFSPPWASRRTTSPPWRRSPRQRPRRASSSSTPSPPPGRRTPRAATPW